MTLVKLIYSTMMGDQWISNHSFLYTATPPCEDYMQTFMSDFTLKSFKNAKVVIQLYFHTSSSLIFMKFDTHKH